MICFRLSKKIIISLFHLLPHLCYDKWSNKRGNKNKGRNNMSGIKDIIKELRGYDSKHESF